MQFCRFSRSPLLWASPVATRPQIRTHRKSKVLKTRAIPQMPTWPRSAMRVATPPAPHREAQATSPARRSSNNRSHNQRQPRPRRHLPSLPATNSDQSANDDYSEASYNPEPEQYAPQPPPELPEYQQPAIPEPGYIWTPGYWCWAPLGYYWVPGVWVAPPYYGALWTPPYWGFVGGRYGFYHGYWGRYIGFYGGVNYGYGYTGRGYQGGYWHGNDFYYNRNVNNISNVHITNVYNRTIVNNITVNNYNRASYNGGPNGVQLRPVPAEVAAYRAPHAPPMSGQLQLQREAAANRAQFASVNHGRPETFVAAETCGGRPWNRPCPSDAPGGQLPPTSGQHHGSKACEHDGAEARQCDGAQAEHSGTQT